MDHTTSALDLFGTPRDNEQQKLLLRCYQPSTSSVRAPSSTSIGPCCTCVPYDSLDCNSDTNVVRYPPPPRQSGNYGRSCIATFYRQFPPSAVPSWLSQYFAGNGRSCIVTFYRQFPPLCSPEWVFTVFRRALALTLSEPPPKKVCSFGPAGERPQCCSAHRMGGMVDVKSKVCAERGCDKRSSFGEAGMPPRFCAKHRPHGMVDVVHRRCETPLCQRHPTYGYRGQRRRFCAHHVVREIQGGKQSVSKLPELLAVSVYYGGA